MNEDSLERELSCGICFELYDVPLQLPCMHTFCKDCLKDILKCSKTRKLKCPDCRRNVDLGKTGIESLKRNFKLASIVEIYREASAKLSTNDEESKKSEAAEKAPSPEEKDYEFLSSLIQSSQENANSPFEPHVIDDLWGTFRRTTRKTSNGSRPPAPLPPRPTPVGKSSTPPSGRPLPPIPRTMSRDVSHRPLPPSPPATAENEYTPFFSEGATVNSPPPDAQAPAVPPAPPYFTLDQCHDGPASEGDRPEDDWVDITSLVHQQSVLSQPPQASTPSIPPLPPRRMQSSPGADSNATRPPIPVPRTKAKGAPVLPKRNSGDERHRGNTMDSLPHRPPPPLPRGRRS